MEIPTKFLSLLLPGFMPSYTKDNDGNHFLLQERKLNTSSIIDQWFQIQQPRSINIDISYPGHFLLYILKGILKFTYSNSNRKHFIEGNHYLINKTDFHEYQIFARAGEYHHVAIPIPDKLVDPLQKDFAIPITASCRGALQQLIEAPVELSPDHLINDLLDHFYHPRQCQHYSADTLEKIVFAKQILDRQAGTPISFSRLIQQTGLNRKYLREGFKAMFGITFKDYQLQQRMALARELLTSSTLPIETIAADLHYREHSSFSAMFRKMFGVTPSVYRETYQY